LALCNTLTRGRTEMMTLPIGSLAGSIIIPPTALGTLTGW